MQFKNLFRLIIILFFVVILQTEVYGLNLLEQVQKYENSLYFKSFSRVIDSLDYGDLGSNTEKVNYILDYYLENSNSKKNNVKYYNNKLIVKNIKAGNPKILSEISSRSSKYQMLGRLYIKDANIDVALFDTNAQACVDAKDSAAYFFVGDTYLVADHWYDGFERIKNCKVGSEAYIDTGDKIVEYVCIGSILGHNTGTDLTDNDYKSVEVGYNPKGITLYTCVNGWRNVRIVFFEPKWPDEIIDKVTPSLYTISK